MPAQQLNLFSSPWLNTLLASALERPALEAAEDAVALLHMVGGPVAGTGKPAVRPRRLSDWLRQALELANGRLAREAAEEAESLALYLIEIIRLMDRHGLFRQPQQRKRAKALMRWPSAAMAAAATVPVDTLAALRLQALAGTPDAGRSQMLQALAPLLPGDPDAVPLLDLVALPTALRRDRLDAISASLLDSAVRGPVNA